MEERILFGIMSLIGYAVLQGGYLPQIIKLYKTKKSSQISITWIGAVNIALWVMYPLALFYAPIEMKIGHTVGLITNTVTLAQLIKYRKN